MSTELHQFFFEHKIFSIEEFVQAIGNPMPTCRAMLNQHVKSGNIVRIKQGLYASIPKGANPEHYPIDPYGVISHLAKDALIAYHSALQFHGISYSMHFQHTYQSIKKIRDFQFRQDRFKVVKYPKVLLSSSNCFINSVEIDHHGFKIRITSIERTLVDVLDRLNLSGGLEEIWRSLANLQQVNIDKIVNYALLLDNTTTIAKVGFYLRTRQKDWHIEEKYFSILKEHMPLSVHYMDRKNRLQGKLIKEWRLMVPKELINQNWEDLFEIGDV